MKNFYVPPVPARAPRLNVFLNISHSEVSRPICCWVELLTRRTTQLHFGWLYVLVPSPDEVFMIISSMTKLVKLGKNLKSHLSLSLSDAAQLATLSAGPACSGVRHYMREKHHPQPIPTMDKQRGQVLIVSTSFLIRPPGGAGWGGERGEGRGRGGETCHCHMWHVCYCTGALSQFEQQREEGGGRREEDTSVVTTLNRNTKHQHSKQRILTLFYMDTWSLADIYM